MYDHYLYFLYPSAPQEGHKLKSWTPRANQLPPPGDDWQIWVILAGRGFGKTRTGAETIRMWIENNQAHNIALIGQTAHDVRHVMVEGSSGLLRSYHNDTGPTYRPANRLLTWPNSTIARTFSGDSYDQLRGPQFDTAWVDELAKFRYPQQTWDQLMLSLRLGSRPRVIVTTTPKPIPVIKNFLNMPGCVITRGSTFENAANLSPSFINRMRTQYENTRLGAQELHAEILDDCEGALWRMNLIQHREAPPALAYIVVAIDPAVSNGPDSAETGIIVAGLDEHGIGYVLDDLSGRYSTNDWASRAVMAYDKYQANIIVAEVNNGGDLVKMALHTMARPIVYQGVRATRGKYVRAEPVAALYEQQRVFHCRRFPELETQMCTHIPGTGRSPDRLDALVWAFHKLIEYQSPRQRHIFS
jgi:phage terminase large subunit-like protein